MFLATLAMAAMQAAAAAAAWGRCLLVALLAMAGA